MNLDEALKIIYSKKEYSASYFEFLVNQGIPSGEGGILETSTILYAQGILELE